jgi:tRNA 2-thiouridine synthesizing protein A
MDMSKVGDEEFLDLRGVMCPFNFVKTKLKLEEMEEGQILAVLLDDGMAFTNVPKSVENEGHTILSQEAVEAFHLVRIKKEV